MKLSAAVLMAFSLLTEMAAAGDGGFFNSCKSNVSGPQTTEMMFSVCLNWLVLTVRLQVVYARQLHDCRMQEGQRPVHQDPVGYEPLFSELKWQPESRQQVSV